MTTKNVHEFIEHENKAISHLQIRHYQPKKIESLPRERQKQKKHTRELKRTHICF